MHLLVVANVFITFELTKSVRLMSFVHDAKQTDTMVGLLFALQYFGPSFVHTSVATTVH